WYTSVDVAGQDSILRRSANFRSRGHLSVLGAGSLVSAWQLDAPYLFYPFRALSLAPGRGAGNTNEHYHGSNPFSCQPSQWLCPSVHPAPSVLHRLPFRQPSRLSAHWIGLRHRDQPAAFAGGGV